MTRTRTGGGVDGKDVPTMLDRWADQGLVSRQQVEQILRAEGVATTAAHPRAAAPATAEPPPASGTREPSSRLVVEALAYLGGVLALAAVLLLLQTWWQDLATGVRLAVPLLAAAALLLAGMLVPGDADERVRLRSALWLLATGAWAAAAAVMGDQVLDAEPRETMLLVGLAGVAMALPLYLRNRTAAQQLALFVSLATTAGALGAQARGDEPTWPGLGVWLVALGWLLLGERRLVAPRTPVRYTASVALVVGALMMQAALGGQVLALVTIVLLFTSAVRAGSSAGWLSHRWAPCCWCRR